MPIRLLVDTCVCLDLAKDYREQPAINALGKGRESSAVAI